MTDYGDLTYDSAWEDSPIEKYFEYRSDHDNLTQERLYQLEITIVESPDGADYQSWDEYIAWREGMTVDDALSFLSQLRSAGLAERTVEEKMVIVMSFVQHLYNRGVVDSNPVSYVVHEQDFEYQEKDKIDLEVDEVGEYLSSISDLQYRGMGVLMGKSGIRIGEAINIDLIDLNIDDPSYDKILDEQGITLHQEVAERPDSLYIPSEPTVGEKYRGEKRKAGNKRKRDTIIPLDDEANHALMDWLAVRPPMAYPHPLWTGQTGQKRIGASTISKRLTGKFAVQAGIIEDVFEEGFNPHWFRHFFSSNLTPGWGNYDEGDIAPTKLKYLRGDVFSIGKTDEYGNDVLETYLHQWGDTIREDYLDAIYQFGLYD